MSRETEKKPRYRVIATYTCGKGHTEKVERTATYNYRGSLPTIDVCPKRKCNAEALLQNIKFM